LVDTVQPAGTGTTTPTFETVDAPVLGPVTKGLGVPTGVGLGRPAVIPPPVTKPRLPRTAITVPQPAIAITSTTTMLMINVHGAR
jgi:hypothetical protein